MPTMHKVEDGYAYDDKLVGNFYTFEGKIIFFSANNKCEEIPGYLIPLITSLVENQTTDLEIDLVSKFDESSSTLSDQLENFSNSLSEVKSEIKSEILENINSKLATLNTITEKIDVIVSEAVDKKLVDVYTNFDLVVKQLVADNVKLIEQDVRNSGQKFKITEIAMLKETGLDIADIVELRKQNMI